MPHTHLHTHTHTHTQEPTTTSRSSPKATSTSTRSLQHVIIHKSHTMGGAAKLMMRWERVWGKVVVGLRRTEWERGTWSHQDALFGV